MKGWLLRIRRVSKRYSGQKVISWWKSWRVFGLQLVEQGYKSGLVRWSRKLLAGEQGQVLLVSAKFLKKLAVSRKGRYTWKHRASGLLCSELLSPRSSVASGRNSSPSIALGGIEKPWKVFCMSVRFFFLFFTSCKLKQCLIYNPYNFFFPIGTQKSAFKYL